MKIKQMTILAAASAAISLLSASAATAQVLQTPLATASPAEAAEYLAYSKCQLCHGPQGIAYRRSTRRLPVRRRGTSSNSCSVQGPLARGPVCARHNVGDGPPSSTTRRSRRLRTSIASRRRLPATRRRSWVPTSPGRSAKARASYNEGIAATGVPPCSACHQGDAAGNDQFRDSPASMRPISSNS